MNDWIKIKDEVPKIGEHIWTWDGKEVSQWRVNGQSGRTDEDQRKFLVSHGITHWQLFITPDPPNK